MTLRDWGMVIGGVLTLAVGLVILWRWLPAYHWYCRRCKKTSSISHFHPRRCTCSTSALVAYRCQACSSWNTARQPDWQCNDCSSKEVLVGAEYHFANSLWLWRNQPG